MLGGLPLLSPKDIYELEDPITYKKFGANGVICVKEGNHYFYFSPESFENMRKQNQGRNPYTRNPMTDYTKISPPESKKEVYEKATRIIQKHAKTFLATRDFRIKDETLICNGRVFRLDFGDLWKPVRPPKIILIDVDFDVENQHKYIPHAICHYLTEHKATIAPGDIIDLGYGYRMNYIFYITIKGTVRFMPDDGGGPHATYVTPQMMKPFWDVRESQIRVYIDAIKFYTIFLSDFGSGDESAYVVHKFHRDNGTLDYYKLDGTIATATTTNDVPKSVSPMGGKRRKSPK